MSINVFPLYERIVSTVAEQIRARFNINKILKFTRCTVRQEEIINHNTALRHLQYLALSFLLLLYHSALAVCPRLWTLTPGWKQNESRAVIIKAESAFLLNTKPLYRCFLISLLLLLFLSFLCVYLCRSTSTQTFPPTPLCIPQPPHHLNTPTNIRLLLHPCSLLTPFLLLYIKSLLHLLSSPHVLLPYSSSFHFHNLLTPSLDSPGQTWCWDECSAPPEHTRTNHIDPLTLKGHSWFYVKFRKWTLMMS